MRHMTHIMTNAIYRPGTCHTVLPYPCRLWEDVSLDSMSNDMLTLSPQVSSAERALLVLIDIKNEKEVSQTSPCEDDPHFRPQNPPPPQKKQTNKHQKRNFGYYGKV